PPWGLRESPIRRQIRCGRPAAQRFFYPGPLLFLPALDLCIFPLQGAPLGFLRTPFQAVHQPTDMIAVIADSELPLNHLGNAGRGPQIGSVTMRSEEHTSELQSRFDLVCRLLLEKKK